MKKNVLKMILLVVLLTTISCGKDTDSPKPNENASTSEKLIKSVKINGGEENLKDAIIHYTYNKENKITKIANSFDVSYQKDKIEIEKFKISATINEKGNVVSLTRIESSEKNYEYKYNTDNQLVQETKKAGKGTIDKDEIYNYHWENGNFVALGDKNNPDVRIEYGKHSNKNNFSFILLNRFSYNKMFLLCLPFPTGKSSEMLPTQVSSDRYSYSYEYEFDKEGYVTKITENYENTHDKEKYVTTFEINY
ncbi:DUF4595 domain-containing protein [Capnocytophaga felis]|uniref:Uncharacterized protein n=1 Tax=Capnocytophaga felis TaxID=2267611 RepID=A0A5M4B9C4_9FLAO|nr:DUF4595 domain-containing protein [Capnocytophaga felis]GET45706.1 hypothetical protein RCZ01_10080 [Capnocytophaga felis]GET47930.1 hypothetical protein RCZ02_07610 [Capnocytophaga felis]